jgi:hypothetical protein
MEISSTSQRALIAMLQFVGWTTGMCVMPMIAWATGGEWKLFMVLTSVPCAAVFLAFRSVTTSHTFREPCGVTEVLLKFARISIVIVDLTRNKTLADK